MPDVEALLADLARWTADARADEAARARMHERWLRRQAEEDAHFSGVALDLAEAGTPVAVGLAGGRTLRGRLAGVGRDFWVLDPGGGPATLVAIGAIATVRPDPGQRARPAASERRAPLDAVLADVLAGLAGDRPRVRVTTAGGTDGLVGELAAVGADVATLRLDGEQGASVYVRLGSIRVVTLLG